MIIGIYSIKDSVTGLFAQPFFAVNEADAIRQFDYLMTNAQMVAGDCSLYSLGEFDNQTGYIDIDAVEPARFIKNGEVAGNVEK